MNAATTIAATRERKILSKNGIENARDMNSSLSAGKKLQLRAEVYNVTNTANFANPNAQLGNPAFGSIASTGNAIPRQMQFAAKLLF